MPKNAAVPDEALQLSESIELALEEGATTIFDKDGCVPIHIIRPGIGRGRGRHLYEANMLSRDAGKFEGWRMYVDHLSPEARKAAGGLPRSVRDLGGRVMEAHWDPSVPADSTKGYGQGAVVGRVKPVRFIRDLIEDDPGLIEASISAQATGVRPVNHQGQRVWMVEGIADRGSVDWVTEAGAGGRVVPLLESAYDSEEAVEMALLEAMSDDEMRAYLTEARPGLLDTPPSSEEGTPPKTLITESEEDDMPLTPEALQEALSEHPEVLAEALKNSPVLDELIEARVDAAVTAERELQEAEREAIVNRKLELRDMRDTATTLIEASQLPESWKTGLKTRFTLQESGPSPELDVVDQVDESGTVTKGAKTVLREAVESAIKAEMDKLAEVAPTRVRRQGPSQVEESADGEKTPKAAPQEKPYWASILSEAGVDPEKAYA